MVEGGKTKNAETNTTENVESKSSFTEKVYKDLASVATKMNNLLFSDDGNDTGEKGQDAASEQADSTDSEKKKDGKENVLQI